MITPPQAGPSMQYDPLMTQFLTQGQMGHMPQAQFMTPHDYGAFRTLPGMQEMGAMPQQQMSMWQAYLVQNQGRIPFMGDDSPPYVFDVYNPAASQPWYQTMAQRRWQDAQMSMGAAVTDMGAATGVALGAGAIGGPVAGIGAGLLAPSVAAPALDRQRGMRDIQAQTIPRIMGGEDVSGLGYGFSAPASQRLDESIRRMGAGDMIFRDEDYREIMDMGIDQGLFDFDISEHQYTQTLKTLRDNVEVMQKLLGSTDFKELMQNMKRLMDMGMDPEFMGTATRMQAGYGFTAGRGIEEMSQAFGQPGAMTFTQAGLTPYQGSFQAMSAAASVEMSRRLGIVSPEEVARQGGVSGMAQLETQNIAQFFGQDGGMSDFMLAASMGSDGAVDPSLVRDISTGEMSQQEIMTRAQATMQRMPQDFMLHRDQYMHEFLDAAGPEGVEDSLFHQALEIGRQVNPSGDTRSQVTAGLIQLGFDRETAAQASQRWTDPEYQELRREQFETEQRHLAEEGRARAMYEDSPIRSAAITVRETMQRFGEETYGRFMEGRARRMEAEERAQMGLIGPERDYQDRLSRMREEGIDEDLRSSFEEFLGRSEDSIVRLATDEERQTLEALEDPTDTQIGWGLRQLQLADEAFGRDGEVTADVFRESLGIRDESVESIAHTIASYGISGPEDLRRGRIQRILQEEFGATEEQARDLIRSDEFMTDFHQILGQRDEGYAARMMDEYRDRWDADYIHGDLSETEDELRGELRSVFGEGRVDEMMDILQDPEQAAGFEALMALGAAEATGGDAFESEEARQQLIDTLERAGFEDPEQTAEEMIRRGGFAGEGERGVFIERALSDPELAERALELGEQAETDPSRGQQALGLLGGLAQDSLAGAGIGEALGVLGRGSDLADQIAMQAQYHRVEDAFAGGVEGLMGLTPEEIEERLEDAEGDERTALRAAQFVHESDDLDMTESDLMAAFSVSGELTGRRDHPVLPGEEEQSERLQENIEGVNAILKQLDGTNTGLNDTLEDLDGTLKNLKDFLENGNRGNTPFGGASL